MARLNQYCFQLFVLLLSALLLSGCESQPLDIHYALDDGNFGNYQSVNVDILNANKNPKAGRITNTIEAVLKEKGYVIAEEADLVVIYDLNLVEETLLKQDQIPYRGNTATQARLEAVYRASLLVNAFDAASQKVVWKAFTTKDITNVDTQNIDQTRLHQRITEIFSSFPEHKH